MGDVYLAVEESLDRRVAIKLLAPHFATKDAALAQFRREAKTMATIEHPNVVRLYAFGQGGDEQAPQPYLVMEFVEGETLDDRIQRRGRLELGESLPILKDTVSALRAAWRRRVVHRDIKPGNILVDREGRARVGDFGIAKPLDLGDGVLTASGVSLGTPRYVSPEQASGEPIDFRSDMYSLGVVFWEMLVGYPPFRDAQPLQLLKRHLTEELPALEEAGVDASEAAQALLDRMTAKEPADRFTSYEELLQALDDLEANPWAVTFQPAPPLPTVEEDESGQGLEDAEKPPPETASDVQEVLRMLRPTGIASSAFEELRLAHRPKKPPADLAAGHGLKKRRDSEPTPVPAESASAKPAPSESSSGGSRAAVQTEPDEAAAPKKPAADVETMPPSAAKDPDETDALPTAADGKPHDSSKLVFWSKEEEADAEEALAAVEGRLDVGRFKRLRAGIGRRSARQRFEKVKEAELSPALHHLMTRFQAKGYPTRLYEADGGALNLEFVLESITCVIELSLADDKKVAFTFHRDTSEGPRSELSMADIDRPTIDRELAQLLRSGLGLA